MARPKKGVTFWDRVYSHVDKRGDCLIFAGCKDGCGYGRINRDGGLVRIHREVWKRDNGEIPEGMEICHKCDTPACIESSHLFAASHADNIRDMWGKGRGHKHYGNTHTKGKSVNAGSRHGLSKLTERAVIEIRASSENYKLLAERYGVKPNHINRVRSGRAWKHVGYGL